MIAETPISPEALVGLFLFAISGPAFGFLMIIVIFGSILFGSKQFNIKQFQTALQSGVVVAPRPLSIQRQLLVILCQGILSLGEFLLLFIAGYLFIISNLLILLVPWMIICLLACYLQVGLTMIPILAIFGHSYFTFPGGIGKRVIRDVLIAPAAIQEMKKDSSKKNTLIIYQGKSGVQAWRGVFNDTPSFNQFLAHIQHETHISWEETSLPFRYQPLYNPPLRFIPWESIVASWKIQNSFRDYLLNLGGGLM